MESDSWRVLVSLLPQGWEGMARSTGALKGLRKDKSAENLLRVLLIHLACGHSLRETVVRARAAQLAELSDVALLKRLRKSKEWLKALCESLLEERRIEPPKMMGADFAFRIFDATTVKEPGPTGSLWRVHYSVRMPSLECDYFKVTETEGIGTGESYARYPIAPGDLILADAAYATARGLRRIDECEAFATVRLNPMGVRLEAAGGAAFDLIRELETHLTETGKIASWSVRLCGRDGAGVAGRLCALRKSPEAIERALKRIRRKATRKRGGRVSPDTLVYARYVLLFTTFPESRFSTQAVLECYRIRWQIELVFKRLKQLARFGHLPKYEDESSKAWLYGKLFVALMTEKIKRHAQSVSPWGYELHASSIAERVA